MNENNSSDEILFYTDECGPITTNGPLYPCDQGNSDPITGVGGSGSGSGGSSSGGTSSGSSNSIPTVTGSNLNSDSRQNYNKYNSFIDDYNFEEDDKCSVADNAKTWAGFQLDYEDDPTLAQHFNRYFSPACNLTDLII